MLLEFSEGVRAVNEQKPDMNININVYIGSYRRAFYQKK